MSKKRMDRRLQVAARNRASETGERYTTALSKLKAEQASKRVAEPETPARRLQQAMNRMFGPDTPVGRLQHAMQVLRAPQTANLQGSTNRGFSPSPATGRLQQAMKLLRAPLENTSGLQQALHGQLELTEKLRAAIATSDPVGRRGR
ncbi:MAG: hypothetical protein AB7O24_03650 [Kofleriaceae bacterium]